MAKQEREASCGQTCKDTGNRRGFEHRVSICTVGNHLFSRDWNKQQSDMDYPARAATDPDDFHNCLVGEVFEELRRLCDRAKAERD